MEQKLVKRASNYAKHVQWVINTYDSEGKGFVHGFQKDAIQNAVGARKSENNFNGWRCEINVVKTEKGTFITVEDFGTVGLTGNNYDISELDRMTSNGEEIPSDQRLARISVDNSSGGDSTSAGLFGVGKTLYAAASNQYWNYFESEAEKEGYRCNMNKNNQMLEKAYEGDEGRNFIKNETGLEPINHIGTRFIVVDPTSDLIDAISGKDEELLHDVEETWWRILKRISNPDDGIFVSGKKAIVPEVYQFNEKSEIYKKDSYFSKEPVAAESDNYYRCKRFGFFINKDIPENLQGFYYYRRGMKIGQIDIRDLEIQFGKPYFGFVELDKEWEKELGNIENATHYDCRGVKKNSNPYHTLKTFVKKTVSGLLEDWGYVKTKESRNKVLNQIVEDIQTNLSDLLAENGYENIGKGDHHPQIDIRLANVNYPNANDAKNARSIYTGENLSFDFSVQNRTARKAKVQISIQTVHPDNTIIKQLKLENIIIDGGSAYNNSFVFAPDAENSIENSVNGLTVVAKLDGSNKVVTRKLIYYFKTETEIRSDLDFELKLHSFQYPDFSNKGKRVDTGEAVKGISYSMRSLLNRPVKVGLRVAALDTANNNDEIAKLFDEEFTLPANGEELISSPMFDAVFSKETFFPKIRKGVVTIRAKMGLREPLPESKLTKGTILDTYEFKVFFNKPEKAGPEIKIIPVEEEGNHKRSWVVETEQNTIAINVKHPEFVAIDANDLDSQEFYMKREATREAIGLYASQGMFDESFGNNISNYEYHKKLDEKIEEIWYQICQK